MKTSIYIALLIAAVFIGYWQGSNVPTDGFPEGRHRIPVDAVHSISVNGATVTVGRDSESMEAMNRLQVEIEQNMKLPPGPRRAGTMAQYLYELAKSDPRQALEIVKRMSFAEQKLGYVSILRGWMEHDIDGAWQWFRDNERNPTLDANTISDITRTFATRDTEWARARINTLPDNLKVAGWKGLFEALESNDKFYAFSGVVNNFGGTNVDRLARAAFYRAWGQAYPQEAMADFQNRAFLDDGHRSRVLDALIGGLVANDPATALSFVCALPGKSGEWGIDAMVDIWFSQGNRLSIVETLSDWNALDVLSDDQIAKIGKSIAVQSPEAALQLVQRVSSTDVKAEIAGSALHAYALVDSGKALDWITQNFAPQDATNLYVRVVLATTRDMSNPEHALRMIKALPTQEARDAAALPVAMRWRTVNREAAVSYFTTTREISEVRRKAVLEFLSFNKP